MSPRVLTICFIQTSRGSFPTSVTILSSGPNTSSTFATALSQLLDPKSLFAFRTAPSPIPLVEMRCKQELFVEDLDRAYGPNEGRARIPGLEQLTCDLERTQPRNRRSSRRRRRCRMSGVRIEPNTWETSNGRYQVRYRDSSGRQRARSFERLTDARNFRARARLLRPHRGNLDPLASRITFEGWAEAYLDQKISLRERTRDRYKSELRAHLVPCFGQRRCSPSPATMSRTSSCPSSRAALLPTRLGGSITCWRR